MDDPPNQPEPIRLAKGANAGLRDLDAELGAVTVVLETGDLDGEPVDADVSVLLLGLDGRVRNNDDLIFYNNPIALDGAINLRAKLRTQDAGEAISADVVTMQLDDVPDDVDRIVLSASIDASLGIAFGAARFVRMRVQRTSDAADLLLFDIEGVAEESALLFGEFYRRRGEWRVRAIGQGYANGFASLVSDFGVELEVEVGAADRPAGSEPVGLTDDHFGVTPEAAADAAASAEPVDGGAVPSAEPSRVSVQRNVRAPKMPAAWNRTIPADSDVEWQVARLFPVAGIGGSEEQERRATSALLAVMAMVRDFGRDITSRLGAPAGNLHAFTEVAFGHDDEAVRPDGVLRIKRGQREWRALVEVKTSDGRLAAPQIDAYLDVARTKGYDAVLTISNQLVGSDGEHPVPVNRKKLKKVALRHLGWDEIRCHCRIIAEHRGLSDATQQRVLEEFLRYMDHPRSGMRGFDDMGQQWVRVREGVKAKTQRSADRSSVEVSNRFEQLVRHTALELSGLLGVDVQCASTAQAADSTSRCQQLADSGQMFGSIRVPGAVSAMIVTADIRTDKVTCSITLPAPREGRLLTRINWLLRQIPEARDAIRIEALLAGSRDASIAALMKTLRRTPESLIPADGRDIKAFRISLDLPMGQKRGTGIGSLIHSVVAVTQHMYAEVVQNLRPAIAKEAKPPRMPE